MTQRRHRIRRMDTPTTARREDRSGFTLVEILVVLTIVSILAGLVTVSVQHARRVADVRATRVEIGQLVAAAENYRSGFGAYPPSSFQDPPLRVKTNAYNEGNEALIAYISTRKKGGPFHGDFSDDRLQNYDNDQLPAAGHVAVKRELDWTRGNNQLLEYTDMWGNPFVYIHHGDYRSSGKIQYMDMDGNVVEVKPVKSEKTGAFQKPTSFQIWSFGPNRINENGGGDDVVSWRE